MAIVGSRTIWALIVSPDELDMYNLAKAGHLLNATDVQKQTHDYWISLVKQSVDKSPRGGDIKKLTDNQKNVPQNISPTNNKSKGDKPALRVTPVRETTFSEGGDADSEVQSSGSFGSDVSGEVQDEVV